MQPMDSLKVGNEYDYRPYQSRQEHVMLPQVEIKFFPWIGH